MKCVNETIEYPKYRWEGIVSVLDMPKVADALFSNRDFYGADILNDMGGTGGWRIVFHRDHDKPDLKKILGNAAQYVDWIESEVLED